MPILVLDDDRDVLEVMECFLRQSGYAVYTFDNGRDAWESLRSGLRPSLILLDLHMPGMTGFEFRDAQLRDPQLAAIPTVVLSGHAMTEHDKAQLGAVRILTKPVEPAVLLTIIKAHRVPQTALERDGS